VSYRRWSGEVSCGVFTFRSLRNAVDFPLVFLIFVEGEADAANVSISFRLRTRRRFLGVRQSPSSSK